MKKAGVLICLSLIFVFSTRSVFAQENISTDGAILLTNPTPTPDGESEEAALPYPGSILPDNQWYFLKVTRDHIIEFLVSDPDKKPAFDLLQANKRLNAGIFLLNQKDGDDSLAISTISKGENYLEDAFRETQGAQKLGVDVSDIRGKIVDAAYAHMIILHDLQENNYSMNTKNKLRSLEERVQQFHQQILIPSRSH